jgi:hypothetical protein
MLKKWTIHRYHRKKQSATVQRLHGLSARRNRCFTRAAEMQLPLLDEK